MDRRAVAALVVMTVACALSLIWASTATTTATAARREVARMKTEAAAAKKEADAYALLQEENMQKLYPGLRKYVHGRNEIGGAYLEAFSIDRGRILTFMRNRAGASARPSFTIVFLTKYGFVTETFEKQWLFGAIEPGQSRIDDDSGIEWRFGEPVYFTITGTP